MQTAILDSSFILTCAKQKIDFFEFLENNGVQAIIPKEVLKEIQGVAKSKGYGKLALQVLKKNKFKEINLGTRNVDSGIIKYAKENLEIIVATLDGEIKNRTRNKKLFIRGKRKLEII